MSNLRPGYGCSKSELALAVLTDQKARWLDRVRRQPLADPIADAHCPYPDHAAAHRRGPRCLEHHPAHKELAADTDGAAEVGGPMADWVSFVADNVRRGQADGELRTGLDAHALVVVLIGAFDGLKTVTDAN